jgi:hypothetical protein
MTIRVWEQGDTVYGRLSLPLRGGGAFSVLLSLTQQQVVAYMHAMGIRFSEADKAQIGSLFGSIGKLVKKVAKNSVMKGVLNVAKGIANSPLVKIIAPEAALAITAASGAAKMITAAKAGNPKAKLAMKAAVAQADLETKQGKQMPVPSAVAAKGPEAAMAFRYMVTVNKVNAA